MEKYEFGVYDGTPRGQIYGGRPWSGTREQAIKEIAKAKPANVPKKGLTFEKKRVPAAHKAALFRAAELWNELDKFENDLKGSKQIEG